MAWPCGWNYFYIILCVYIDYRCVFLKCQLVPSWVFFFLKENELKKAAYPLSVREQPLSVVHCHKYSIELKQARHCHQLCEKVPATDVLFFPACFQINFWFPSVCLFFLSFPLNSSISPLQATIHIVPCRPFSSFVQKTKPPRDIWIPWFWSHASFSLPLPFFKEKGRI